jgi:uncharacterized phage protein gp47/JayE
VSEYGITDDGFVLKRLDEILNDKNEAVTEVLGPDVNLSPQTVDGQINGVYSESDSNLWQLAQHSYNSFNPDAATGVQLDNLVQLNGITRLDASPSTVSLELTGTASTVIPAGSIVATSSGIQFQTDAEVTISGITEVAASAVIPGATQALAGTIIEIITPVVGWNTVNNPADATLGRDRETDAALRIRRAKSVAFPSQSLLESIFSAIANIEGVAEVIVLENDTSTVDENGQDPHSVQAIVNGGDDQEIAEAIFNEKSAGIATVGSTTVQVLDIQDLPHDINFQRPTDLDIYVTINLTTFADYPANGADLIKQAIIDYAALNINIGTDVINSRLYCPINEVQGHTIDEVLTGTTPSPTLPDDIPVPFDNLARFQNANIIVNETPA